ncbi:hypothetical protein, partial [Streptomyces sp. NPDC003487]
GVGKTTTTTALGSTLATERQDKILAIRAAAFDPAERVVGGKTPPGAGRSPGAGVPRPSRRPRPTTTA